MNRVEMLVRDLDHLKMRGVEIGPWFSPIAPKAAGWSTTVVDFTDAESLREIAINHSAESIRAAASHIEDVDVVWRGQPLDEACLVINPDGYDFLIASHVLEHIPNLIGFLNEADRLLKPSGMISLALPDMRFCFDFFKPLTMTSGVLAAHREQRVRHAPETLYEANAYQGWKSGAGAWLRDSLQPLDLACSVDDAYSVYLKELATANDIDAPYVDAHAWVFTPASFSLVMFELNQLGLSSFALKQIDDGEGGEFYAQLIRRKREDFQQDPQMERKRLLIQMVRESASRMSQFQDNGN